MDIVNINGYKLRKYNQVNGYVNYRFQNLNYEQVNDIYLELCNKYDTINRFYHESILNDKVQGYFMCK
jgi:hypothetical protein